MTSRIRKRLRVPPVTLPALVALAMLFGGLDNGFGYGLLYLGAGSLLIVQLLSAPPDRAFRRSAYQVVGLFALAAVWGAWASLGFAGSGGSLAPDLLRHELVGLGAYACVLLLAASMGRTVSRSEDLIDWFNLFALGVMIFGLLINYGPFEGLTRYWEAGGGRFTGTMNNANVAGACSGTTAVLALGRLFDTGSERGRGRSGRIRVRALRWLHLAVLAIAFVCVLLTAGRVITLATVSALVALAAVAWRRGQLSAALAVPAAVVVGGVWFAQFAYRLLQRVSLLEVHAVERSALWAHYWAIASQSPWVGYGLGAFPMVHARHLQPLDFARSNWTVNSPHNIAVHLLLQAGWPYLLLTTAICAVVIAGFPRLRKAPITDLAMLGSAVLLLACGMVDIALEVPAVVSLLLMLAGLLWGRGLRAKRAAA